MKRLLFFLVSLVGLTMWADTAPDAALTRLMRYVRNVETFNRVFPQEKVYLHLDNTGYFMGDSIWWKAYVVRTDSGRLSNLSRVLYVELVDPFGNVLELQKRPIEGGQAYGNLKMRKSLSDGFYEIRAYTRYMTNWDAAGIYSRVVPVFQRPTEEGAYGEMKINRTFDDFRRQTYYMPDSLTRRERRSWRKDPPPEVTFYPEGGHLVRGLQSTVAFQVACKDTAAPDVTARLVDSRGDTISYLPTMREGRGLLVCTPDTARLRLCVPVHGQMYTFPLPTAEDTGCVLTVGATAPRTIPVEVAASPSLQGRLLGLSLMHGGNVLAFDTVRPGAEPAVRLFERADLPPGVHQLTLFDERGRIWAERLFFIAPPQAGGALPVEARFADNLIAPYRKMQLTLRGQPGTTLSLSVMDADATPTGHQANAATWLLLASELQGYVRDAAYYLEADDAAHRSATDLLMRVQGWRRYDWRMMSGNAPFVKRQPVEDSLYLYGRVEPRQLYGGGIFSTKRTRARAKQVDHVELSATLYNQDTPSPTRPATMLLPFRLARASGPCCSARGATANASTSAPRWTASSRPKRSCTPTTRRNCSPCPSRATTSARTLPLRRRLPPSQATSGWARPPSGRKSLSRVNATGRFFAAWPRSTPTSTTTWTPSPSSTTTAVKNSLSSARGCSRIRPSPPNTPKDGL